MSSAMSQVACYGRGAVWSCVLMALLTAPSVAGHATSQAPIKEESAQERVLRALDEGDYGQAEYLAEEWRAHVEAEDGPGSLAAAQASDLLVEALVQNGKAGAISTLTLAERVVQEK